MEYRPTKEPSTTTPKSTFKRPSRRPNIRKPSSGDSSSNKVESGGSSSTSLTSTAKGNGKYKLVCYYTNWSQYRPNAAKFVPESLDANLCTHIIYAFGWMKKGKLSSLEANDESVDGKVGLYERIMSLKKSNKELKILLAVGNNS